MDEESTRTCDDLMQIMREELLGFKVHSTYVEWHKGQMASLLQSVGNSVIIIKSDFIQNLVHSRGCETSQLYYGKRQMQLLTFVVWYTKEKQGESIKHKLYVDYLSSYLIHSSMYF